MVGREAGVPRRRLVEAALAESRRGGIALQRQDPLCGFERGVGLQVREPPIIERGAETVVQAGTVLALEPWLPKLAAPGSAAGVLVLDGMVWVTGSGSDLLAPLSGGVRISP